MIKFTRPTNLNGVELLAELNAAGIEITEPPFDDAQGNLYLSIADADMNQAALVIAAHDGTIIAPDNSAKKAALLAKLGITSEEAALLLG
jgi:hypothetical protein